MGVDRPNVLKEGVPGAGGSLGRVKCLKRFFKYFRVLELFTIVSRRCASRGLQSVGFNIFQLLTCDQHFPKKQFPFPKDHHKSIESSPSFTNHRIPPNQPSDSFLLYLAVLWLWPFFVMVSSRGDPLKCESWPPTKGWKGHGLNQQELKGYDHHHCPLRIPQ